MVALKVFLDFTEHLVDLLNEAGEQLAAGAERAASEKTIIYGLVQFGDVIIHAELALVTCVGNLFELGAHLAGIGYEIGWMVADNVFFLFA